jgi:hypothetical protein
VVTDTGERWNVAPNFLQRIVEARAADDGDANAARLKK